MRNRLRQKGANGKAETIHNLIQGRKDLIFKDQFSDFFPNLFDGIHFRCIGGNVKKTIFSGMSSIFDLCQAAPSQQSRTISSGKLQ